MPLRSIGSSAAFLEFQFKNLRAFMPPLELQVASGHRNDKRTIGEIFSSASNELAHGGFDARVDDSSAR